MDIYRRQKTNGERHNYSKQAKGEASTFEVMGDFLAQKKNKTGVPQFTWRLVALSNYLQLGNSPYIQPGQPT